MGKGGGASGPTESKVVQSNLPEYAEPYYKDLLAWLAMSLLNHIPRILRPVWRTLLLPNRKLCRGLRRWAFLAHPQSLT